MPRATRRGDLPSSDPGLTRLLLAFAAVYVIWGSTYLAIRWAIETMPPLGMASLRFLVAGSIMFVWALSRGAPMPTPMQWRTAAISGTLLLAGGNGAVVLAEQWVPSGLVALLVASVPLWLAILDWAAGSRERPTRRTIVGLLGGFGGVGVLAGSPGVGAGGARELLGMGIVLLGALSWAAGSLVSRYQPAPPRPRMVVGQQMLVGSLVLGVLALATGEADGFAFSQVSMRSWAAFIYLVGAGAIVGYAAYIWLLTVVSPARAGTYAYVNPVVAMLLGWGLADEPLTGRSLLAASIILASVVVISTESRFPRGGGRGLPVSDATRGSP